MTDSTAIIGAFKHSLLNQTIFSGLQRYIPKDIEDGYNHLHTLEKELDSFIKKMTRTVMKFNENIDILKKTLSMSETSSEPFEILAGKEQELKHFQKRYQEEVVEPVKKKISSTIGNIIKDIEKKISETPPYLHLTVKTVFLNDTADTVKSVIIKEPAPDASICLTYLFLKKIPYRYNFFYDDEVRVKGIDGISFWYDEPPFTGIETLDTVDSEDDWLKSVKEKRIPVKTYIPIFLFERKYPRFRIIRDPDICQVSCRRDKKTGYSFDILPDDVPYLLSYLLSFKENGQLDLDIEME